MRVKEGGWTGFSSQPSLPARGKHCPSRLFYSDLKKNQIDFFTIKKGTRCRAALWLQGLFSPFLMEDIKLRGNFTYQIVRMFL